MSDRRTFLGVGVGAAATVVLAGQQGMARLSEATVSDKSADPEIVAADEAFWHGVRRAFALEPRLVNLNHGYSPNPESVLDALDRAVRRTSRAPLSFGHWPEEGPEPTRESVRRRAAVLLGCNPEELALTRSATEALQIVQLGLTLRPGDEALTTSEDYWAMWNTWQQRVQRDGVIYSEVRLGAPHPPVDEVIDRITKAITPKTKILLIPHITWLTGHVLPVAEICRAARERGVLTIVDGAHGPGHVPVDVRALGCDFYGASGHKWLMGPLGTGFLYVRRELIRDVWPLTPAFGPREDVRKFEWVGGQSTAPALALSEALTFHEHLGVARKAARFRFLRRRWTDRLGAQPRVRLLTSRDAERACGLGSFAIDGIEPAALVRYLRERHRVLVRSFGAAEWDGPAGVRVAPNVFNSAAEIDRLAEAVEMAIRDGVPCGGQAQRPENRLKPGVSRPVLVRVIQAMTDYRDIDPRHLVRDSYDRISLAYRGDTLPSDRGYFRWLEVLTPYLQQGDAVLDLGCGCGVPMAQALSQFCDVTGIDISPVQIERARKLVPRGTFECRDIASADCKAGHFDAIVSLFSIIHLPVREHRPLLERMCSWLRPGGYLLISLGHSAWTGYEKDWYGAPMYWSHADEQTSLKWLEETGFEVLWQEFLPEGKGGHRIVLAQRPS